MNKKLFISISIVVIIVISYLYVIKPKKEVDDQAYWTEVSVNEFDGQTYWTEVSVNIEGKTEKGSVLVNVGDIYELKLDNGKIGLVYSDEKYEKLGDKIVTDDDIVLYPEYDILSRSYERYSCDEYIPDGYFAKKDGKWGIINKSGEIEIEVKYRSLSELNDLLE